MPTRIPFSATNIMFIHVLFKIFFRPLSLPFGGFEQFEGFPALPLSVIGYE
jgi:hypothetical protein